MNKENWELLTVAIFGLGFTFAIGLIFWFYFFGKPFTYFSGAWVDNFSFLQIYYTLVVLFAYLFVAFCVLWVQKVNNPIKNLKSIKVLNIRKCKT